MWIEFFITVFFAFIFIYIPGWFFFKAIKFNALNSLIFAPIYSISIYSILGIVYCWLSFPANWSSLFLPALCLGVFAFLISCILRKQKLRSELERSNSGIICFFRSDWAVAGLYILVALVISYFYYINTLDGSYSFAQDSDNSWHLSLIQAFAQFENMSILDTSLYHDLNLAEQETLMPSSGSFYPAAWHILAAMATQLTSVPVSVSANAVNFIILAVIIPLCEFVIIRKIFEKRSIHILGAFVSVGFIAYPWGMVLASSGPLFPNLLGFAVVPALFAGIVSILQKEKIEPFISLVIMLCLGMIAMVSSHPNALFTLLILVVPYLAAYLIGRVDGRNKKVKSFILICVVVCLSLFGWYFIHELPFFQSTVSYNWASFASFQQEIVNIVFLGFRLPVTQLVLSVVLLIGVLYLLFKKQARWLLVSYVICCVFCFIGATTDGWLKSFLTGFWYTDPYRLGAMAALIAIPITAAGLHALFRTIRLVIEKLFDRLDQMRRKRLNIICSVFLAIMLIALNYYPNFSLKGLADIETAFGYYEDWNTYANLQDRPNLYSAEESQFVEKVSKLVDPDYSIYNCGDDGSPFAYALNNLNLCYRRSAATLLDGGETYQSELLRNKLNELSYNTEVQNAIQNANIKYVLILDLGGQATADRCYYGYYTPSKWLGINAINDETPGLKCLLAEGDMRLYEIEPFD